MQLQPAPIDNAASQLTIPRAEIIGVQGTAENQSLLLAEPTIRSPLPEINSGDDGRNGDEPDLLLAALPPIGRESPAVASGFALGEAGATEDDPLEIAAEARIAPLYASINHGSCAGGWGPKPKKINARRINPGDPYYIEIRMRHTPMLAVGHTYVAYGKLDANGEPNDENLIMLAPIGGYAGAAIASGIPMPGILTPHRDDCRIRPEAAYRVSLNAQAYENLLLEIHEAKRETPSYLLFSYNCNHFMARIVGSVGLKPPKNAYVPALEYIYAMIEANEGRRIARW